MFGKKRALNHLNQYLWKYRGRLALGTLFIILANVFNVYAPIMIGEGIDFLAQAMQQQAQQQETITLNAPNSLHQLSGLIGREYHDIVIQRHELGETIVKIGIYLALGYLLFYILKGIFLFYQRQTIIVMSRHIEYDLKNEIYGQYQRLDASFYKRNRTGDLMNRISEDVNRVRMYLGPAIMYTINLVVLVIMCIVVMLRIEPELTLYTLSPLPFMMVGIFYVSQIINRRTDRVQNQQSRLSTFVQETMSGIRVLKSFHREKFYADDFSSQSDLYKDKQMALVKADALFMPVIALLVGLSTLLTIYIGANKVASGQITYGVIVQFVFYVNQLTWPFASVGWVSSLVQKAEASQKRINEFLEAQPEIVNPEQTITPIQGKLVFDKVSFTYPESGIEALKDISFTVEPGETLAIVGRTGSGKSTIAQLIMRMYDPTTGEISLDNTSLRKINLDYLRIRTGYVPQEVFLFSDTIANNISFGLDRTSLERIVQAAKDADVHTNILGFPDQYNTLLGERGINLSGGQKQRVSIARALIKSPDILLFDDCFSAVDTQTEENILNSLKRIMKNKTTVMIAHRISSIKHADKIIVLDQGKIIESGTHESLIQNNGLYASLYSKQLLESQIIE